MADHDSGEDRTTSEDQDETEKLSSKKISDSQKDEELNDILDDALEDFGKISSSVQTLPSVALSNNVTGLPPSSTSLPTSAAAAAAAASDENESQDALFNKLFNDANVTAGIEGLLSSLMTENPAKLREQFQGCVPSGETGGNITDTLHQTIGSLVQNAQHLQSSIPEDGLSEEDIQNMLSSMGIDGSGFGGGGAEVGGDEEAFLPLMQGMMKNLLSKDVLYPSLKEITSQYPKWLSENSGKVEAKQFENYENQFRLMSTIVDEFDAENESDSTEVKSKRFERILDSMQKMQELGHPPKEIVGDMPDGVELDENGIPKLPSGLFPSPEQCNVM